MKKFINDPMQVVDEMLEGYLFVNEKYVRRSSSHPRVLLRRDAPVNGKVAVVTGGGSGHKPSFIGFLGKGMLDAVCVGEIFTSPPVPSVLDAVKSSHAGKGVLLLLGNYSGDVMNFEMAAELAQEEGIEVEQSIATDDVGAGFRDEPQKRRGVSGEFLIWKCCGAMAERGERLGEVKRIAEKVNANVRTMGVAISSCTVPAAGKPTFMLAENEMEVGVGHHGEPGVMRMPLEPVDKIVDMLTEKVVGDLPFESGYEVVTLINGLGATPLLELYIAQRRLQHNLNEAGIHIVRSLVGEYFTALEMAGFSITMLRVDQELKELLAAPAETPYFVQI
jgi:phosphoenolpyruvate---glycerone phosphotransferase subunit DhaK